MYPELFHIFGLVVYSYGCCIMAGALLAYWYGVTQAEKLDIPSERIAEMAVYIFVAAYAGGKVFLWFPDWDEYMQHPARMLELSGSGFVFYGSFIFCIGTLWWFFRRYRMPAPAMFDILAVCGTLVHGFGKIGCFLAGCCHGKPSGPWPGVTYDHPLSNAAPLHVPLHPVQLYDAVMIFGCTFLLLCLRNKPAFRGKLIWVYAAVYAMVRFCTEFLRGDEDRGYVLNNTLSHGQVVSLLILATASVIFLLRRYPALLPMHRRSPR